MSVFEIVKGCEGDCLILDDTRIAGPKPWGGGTVVKRFETKKEYGEVIEHETCEMRSVPTFPGTDSTFRSLECSACGMTNDENNPKFCPNCGAEVRK